MILTARGATAVDVGSRPAARTPPPGPGLDSHPGAPPNMQPPVFGDTLLSPGPESTHRWDLGLPALTALAPEPSEHSTRLEKTPYAQGPASPERNPLIQNSLE